MAKLNYITFHWTAGTWTWTNTEHYHYIVSFDNKAKLNKILPLNKAGSHTWKRNSGNIGIAFAGMLGATSVDFGKYPIKPEQIEMGAKLAAELSIKYNIPLANIKDHAYYARLDGYYPDRWDVGIYWPQLEKKIKWYYEKLKLGKIRFEYT